MENTENKTANSFLADRMAGLVDAVGNPIAQESKEENTNVVEEPTAETEVENTVEETVEPTEVEEGGKEHAE
jgi:hypothetical protein